MSESEIPFLVELRAEMRRTALACARRPSPRDRLLTHRRSAMAAMVAAAAAAATVVSLATSTTTAFAGWTAIPTNPSPMRLATQEALCRGRLGAPALADTRGPYTFLLYVTGNRANNLTQVCWNGRVGIAIKNGPSPVSGSPIVRSASALFGAVPAGTVEFFGGWAAFNSSDVRLIIARLGAGVRSVTMVRTQGEPVQATVSHGWALAWWPGGARSTTVRITTASGTTTQSF